MPGVTVHKAMILAAGLGTRMRAYTDTVPKPLVEIAGRTLLDRCLDRLEAAGIREIVVNVHHKADQIEAHLAQKIGKSVKISDERAQLMDTGGGLAKAHPHLGEAPFFTVNSDSIWLEGYRPALDRMAARFDPERMDALLLMSPMNKATGYDGRGDFLVKPWGQLAWRPWAKLAPFVFMGVQLVHPRFLADAPDGPFSIKILWNRAMAAGRLFGIRHDGLWMHVGSPDGVDAANRILGSFALK